MRDLLARLDGLRERLREVPQAERPVDTTAGEETAIVW